MNNGLPINGSRPSDEGARKVQEKNVKRDKTRRVKYKQKMHIMMR